MFPWKRPVTFSAVSLVFFPWNFPRRQATFWVSILISLFVNLYLPQGLLSVALSL